MKPVPGMKFKAAVGPATAGFAPNINFVDETFAGSLDDYVTGNMRTLAAMMANYRPGEKVPFVTDQGLQGVKLVTESRQRGFALRQTFYFFANGNTKYVATCSTLAEDGERLAEFDAAMRTFRFAN